MEHLGVSAAAIDRSFSARFRLQKATYLLKQLGVRPFSEYSFNLYIHGPYSPTLAEQYYSARPGGPARLSPEVVNKLDWFVDHSDNWIELASAILSLRESNPGIADGDLLPTLRMSKPWVTDSAFRRTLHELDEAGLIR
jgi:hypothetical protein